MHQCDTDLDEALDRLWDARGALVAAGGLDPVTSPSPSGAGPRRPPSSIWPSTWAHCWIGRRPRPVHPGRIVTGPRPTRLGDPAGLRPGGGATGAPHLLGARARSPVAGW